TSVSTSMNMREPRMRQAFGLTCTGSRSDRRPDSRASNTTYAVISLVRLAGGSGRSAFASASTLPVEKSARYHAAASICGGGGTSGSDAAKASTGSSAAPSASHERIDVARLIRPRSVVDDEPRAADAHAAQVVGHAVELRDVLEGTDADAVQRIAARVGGDKGLVEPAALQPVDEPARIRMLGESADLHEHL